MLRRRRGPSFQARGLGGALGLVPAQKNPRQCGVLHLGLRQPPPWGGRWEVRMRSISSFVIVVGLILAATGIGVWAASRTTNHAKAGAKAVNVEDTREGVPLGGGLFVMPPVY